LSYQRHNGVDNVLQLFGSALVQKLVFGLFDLSFQDDANVEQRNARTLMSTFARIHLPDLVEAIREGTFGELPISSAETRAWFAARSQPRSRPFAQTALVCLATAALCRWQVVSAAERDRLFLAQQGHPVPSSVPYTVETCPVARYEADIFTDDQDALIEEASEAGRYTVTEMDRLRRSLQPLWNQTVGKLLPLMQSCDDWLRDGDVRATALILRARIVARLYEIRGTAIKYGAMPEISVMKGVVFLLTAIAAATLEAADFDRALVREMIAAANTINTDKDLLDFTRHYGREGAAALRGSFDPVGSDPLAGAHIVPLAGTVREF
jgi:hypothetical protein